MLSLKRKVLKAMYLSLTVMVTFLFLSFLAQDIEAAPFAYITNSGSNNISVIDTATNTVVATVPVGILPYGVSVNTAGTRVYVANQGSNNISVIDTVTNTVVATVPIGSMAMPSGVSVNPAGTRVYVTNFGSTIGLCDRHSDKHGSCDSSGRVPASYGFR